MLKVNDLTFKRQHLNYRFSFEVNQNELVCFHGPSGVGKSTLLNLIAGFEQPVSGEILFEEKDLINLPIGKRPLSMLFQEDNLFPHLDGRNNIAIGINQNLSLNKDQIKLVDSTSNALGINQQLDKLPEHMSGGQKQRVALARCMVRNRPLILLDEPFSALDKALRLECLALLQTLAKEKGWTVLLVSHQPDEAQPYVDRLIDMSTIMS